MPSPDQREATISGLGLPASDALILSHASRSLYTPRLTGF